MQGGDIDNGTPPRVLVHLDVVVQRRPEVTKILGMIPVTRQRAYYDRLVLNHFWLFTSRNGVNLELFDTDCSQDDMDSVMEDLERIGLNPFRWASAYDSVQQLVDEMPYRPELLGVIDLPERAFRYGSKYYDLGRV
jgi:hypothetical protein